MIFDTMDFDLVHGLGKLDIYSIWIKKYYQINIARYLLLSLWKSLRDVEESHDCVNNKKCPLMNIQDKFGFTL